MKEDWTDDDLELCACGEIITNRKMGVCSRCLLSYGARIVSDDDCGFKAARREGFWDYEKEQASKRKAAQAAKEREAGS